MPRRPVLDLGPIRLRAVAGDGPDYRWRAEWYPAGRGGKQSTRALGGRCSAADAARRGAELLDRGLHLDGAVEAQDGPQVVATVADVLELWLGAQLERSLSPHSKKAYRHSAEACARVGGAWRLEELTGGLLIKLRDVLAETYAPQTVRLHLSVLGFAWRWAGAHGLVGPLPALPQVRVPRTIRHTPTPAEVSATLQRIEGWPGLLLAIAFSTGGRIGELLGLDWADLDLRAETVRLSGKTGPRVVPLAGAGLRAARGWPPAQRAGLLRGGAEAQSTNAAEKVLRYRLAAACAAAGVPGFTIHGLRRLAVDQMLRSGVEIGTAATITGHSAAVMLAHYRQVTSDDQAAAVAQAQLGEGPAPAAGAVLPLRRRAGPKAGKGAR